MSHWSFPKSITAGTYNDVQGNQLDNSYNTTTIIHGNVIHNASAAHQMTERTECDEVPMDIYSEDLHSLEKFKFRRIIRGDVIVLRDLGSQDLSEWEWDFCHGVYVGRLKSRLIIQIITIFQYGDTKFTAIKYEGRDAQELWEKDFELFSRKRSACSVQLFGINRSDIPMLIFHHELIPLKHFYQRTLWMEIYLNHVLLNLTSQFEVCGSVVWMDTQKGELCHGPDGPEVVLWNCTENPIISPVAPLTIAMLNGDTFLRFFSQFGPSVDKTVLHFASILRNVQHCPSRRLQHDMKCPGNGVTLEGWLRFDTVYSPSLPLARWPEGTYGPRWNAFNAQSLENTDAALRGLMRLKLTAAPGEEISVTLIFDAKDVWPKAWMSQSSRVFDATESMEACEGFFIIKPAWLRLVGRRPSDPASGSDFRGGLEPPTIFFFFRQLPETVEDLVSLSKRFPKEPELYHFWSFDENGQTSMTEVECQRWHLPVMALEENPNYANLISWPVSTYADIQHWQKARGFKSSTADYALSMGIPAIDVTERIQASDHPPYFQNPSDEEKSKKPKFTSVPRSEGGTEFFHSVIHLNEGVLAEISTDSDVYDPPCIRCATRKTLCIRDKLALECGFKQCVPCGKARTSASNDSDSWSDAGAIR